MRLPKRPRLTYANAMSTLAVVLCLSMGTAYAAGLANNSVKSRHIAPKAVKASDLGDGAVGSAALGNNAVGPDELADDAVDSGAIASSAVGDSEIAADSVGGSELEDNAVTGANIVDESITGIDIQEGAISSTRMTSGVKNLLFDTGTIAFLKDDFATATVTSTSWPGGAPNSGAQLSFSWDQPPGTYDVATIRVRLGYEDTCTDTTSATARGIDIKAVDADGRVISASSAIRQDGVNYNGNGFWAEQAALDGVSFRVPAAGSPDALVDYTYIPLELADFVTSSSASSDASRTIRVYYKTNSTNCDITVSQARAIVYRFS